MFLKSKFINILMKNIKQSSQYSRISYKKKANSSTFSSE
jgi:hypothetical protein